MSKSTNNNSPRIILIKTSSLGDVLHNLPVVTDILQHFPAALIDWVVEESFAALPALHPGIHAVMPVAMRRWRKSWWQSRKEIGSSCRKLGETSYDFALDTQGLLKSALVTRCTKAIHCGLDRGSVREPLASMFYNRTYHVPKNMHAVERNRQLAAQALGYSLDTTADYGIVPPDVPIPWLPTLPYVVLLHATSRDDKLWSEFNWIELGEHFHAKGICSILPWGNDQERIRSERLTEAIPDSICSPRLDLREAAALLGQARAVVGVDTGLCHLAAALQVPTIGLYTSTDPGLTGLYAGNSALNLGGKGTPPDVSEVINALASRNVYV